MIELRKFNADDARPSTKELGWLDQDGKVDVKAVIEIFQGAVQKVGKIETVYIPKEDRPRVLEETRDELVRARSEGEAIATELASAQKSFAGAKSKKLEQKIYKLETDDRKAAANVENLEKRVRLLESDDKAQYRPSRKRENRKDTLVVVQERDNARGALLVLDSKEGVDKDSKKGSKKPGKVFDRQADAIWEQLIYQLDDQLSGFYWSAFDGAARLSWLQSESPDVRVDILQRLVWLSLFDVAAVGQEIKNYGPLSPNRAAIDSLNLRDSLTDSTPDKFNFFCRTADHKLWVPKRMPRILIDPEENDRCFRPKAGRYLPDDVGGVSMIACYQKDGDWVVPIVVRGESQHSGAGGGKMRSDNVEEYCWTGPKALGYALGLDLERYQDKDALAAFAKDNGFIQCPTPRLPTAKTPTPSERKGSMASEITYYKKFGKGGEGKKNEPKQTIPHLLTTGSKSGEALVKKQKGDWAFDGPNTLLRQGQELKHANGDRLSAGGVMGAAFKERGFAPTRIDVGSATAFSRYVVRGDKLAEQKWKELSAGVTAYPEEKVDLDALKATVRTDQEWCHLFGHGDGGQEDYDNFISGSKHCNTEQLAIECGQRYQKHDNLTARITAYLIPNDGFSKKTITKGDSDYLAQFHFSTPLNLAEVNKLEAALSSGDKAAAAALAPFLPTSGRALTVPTQAEFDQLDAASKRRVCKDVYRRLGDALKINFPLGLQVRYKIYSGTTKVFDHLFNAQKESFDFNEFKILEHTVKRVIAVALSSDTGDENDTAAAFVQSVNVRIGARAKAENDEKPPDDYELP